MSYKVTLNNVPVSYWRSGTEFFPNGGVVKSNQLTHLFGDITADQSFPRGDQNGTDFKTLALNQVAQDYTATSPRPNFTTVDFLIQNPAAPVDIDSIFPNILIGYNYAGSFNTNKLADYLNEYLFTQIPAKDGKNYARIHFKYKPELSFKPGFYERYIDDIINEWVKIDRKTFDKGLSKFCAGGGNKNIPVYNGTYPNVLPLNLLTQSQMDEAYPYYSLYPSVCGCSMPADYYINNDIMNIQADFGEGQHEDANLIYQALKSRGGLNSQATCNQFANCKSGSVLTNQANNQIVCPALNLQICQAIARVTTGNINARGDNTNIGNVSQKLNCQQNGDGSQPPPPQSPPPPPENPFLKFYKKRRMLVLLSAIAIVVILLILLII